MKESKMHTKTVKILSGCALGIQLAALLFTILIAVCQKQVKVLFVSPDEVQGVTSVPFVYIAMYLVSALLYLMLLVFAYRTEEKKGLLRTAGIVLFIAVCVFDLLFGFVSRLESILIANKGMAEVASLSVVNSAISMVTGPLVIVAFGLFSMAVGAGLALGTGGNE
jgi:hypothetical protein